jgi:cytochrome c oxidase subunit 2
MFYSFFSFNFVSCDSAQVWQFGFQDPASPIAEGIIKLHNDIMVILVFIVLFVGWMQVRAIQLFDYKKNPVASTQVHGSVIEIIWTVLPALILMGIAVPSFSLLYAADEINDPAITLKVIGSQWYWNYEYSDYTNEDGEVICFESYMVPEDELNKGDLRLLEVDNRVVLPINTHIRFIVTASDVLHCFAMPSLALKLDCCPGRLNQVSTFIKREGTF